MLTKIFAPFLMLLLMVQLRAADAGEAREKSRGVANVDATSLRGKVLCGYQGWFRCPGDDSKEGWIHWSHDSGHLQVGTLSVELWPDMSEYSAPERFAAPGFTNAQGEQACLFSSDQPATVRRHFSWMRGCGIDGVWLQHFVVDLPGGPLEGRYASRSRVLANVRVAARETGRAWAIAFDIAGMPTNKIFEVLTREWRKLVDQGVTGDDRYVHEGSRPAVLIWGFYYQDPHNAMTPELANQLIDFFKTPGPYRAFLVGGGDWAWRYNPDSAWKGFLRRFDGYSPWNVGNVSPDKQKVLHAAIDTWAKDKEECDRRGMLWLPVVYPGFSWDNLQKQPTGSSLIPRRKGSFLWEQFQALSKLGADSVCVAMFDEVDEGTAIFKVSNMPPSPGHFVTYEGMPSDWYLRLVGEGTRMLRAKQAIPLKIPLTP